ncbi:flagellar motor switch protein FliG [Swingsia samuiensis]|uniref:Flagellar motor switch protein FliG n=1 Tax=Swingsia samuiensis TaxID=1293412 RepID=A0A4Y6ULL8_9PROT|nr:flagellar motor switch protein FliG [Swingsia samuiensis]
MKLLQHETTGSQKAAILMMTLGEANCALLFEQMKEEEIRKISVAMSELGIVTAETVERVCKEFSHNMGSTGSFVGDLETTERLLKNSLSDNRADAIMQEIRGPAGRTMWEKLGNVSENVLANYLKQEHPQTVAVVLKYIKVDHAAKVLGLFEEDFAVEVMERMLNTHQVSNEILQSIEKALRLEFVGNAPKNSQKDSYEVLADIFNNFDRRNEERFMAALEVRSLNDAERVKNLMFTFEDLVKLSPEGLTVLLSKASRDLLPIALKGASDGLRKSFFNTMSERARRMLEDEINNLGPVRIKDVDLAQSKFVQIAKDLLEQNEIDILDLDSSDNEFI